MANIQMRWWRGICRKKNDVEDIMISKWKEKKKKCLHLLPSAQTDGNDDWIDKTLTVWLKLLIWPRLTMNFTRPMPLYHSIHDCELSIRLFRSNYFFFFCVFKFIYWCQLKSTFCHLFQINYQAVAEKKNEHFQTMA